MQGHSFVVVATGLDHNAEDFEDRFYAKGCDDAVVSVVSGLIHVDFTREAASLDEAIVSATDAVMATGARIIRVDR